MSRLRSVNAANLVTQETAQPSNKPGRQKHALTKSTDEQAL